MNSKTVNPAARRNLIEVHAGRVPQYLETALGLLADADVLAYLQKHKPMLGRAKVALDDLVETLFP